jgi:hypothetical protein
MVSQDKDFKSIPGNHYNPRKQEFFTGPTHPAVTSVVKTAIQMNWKWISKDDRPSLP